MAVDDTSTEVPVEDPHAIDPATSDGVPSVVVEDTHVTYRIYEDRRAGLRQVIANGFKPRPYRQIQALRGVTFTALSGESIGVIGANGSGKSTLLRAIAGLLPVTAGVVFARSRPALLGVGAALQPNLSGRRNVFIGCLALGLSKDDIKDRYQDIVSFAGLEDVMDLPMRAYSTGMRARLMFAIATSVTPDILLVDEALAVGDQQFRSRSLARLHQLRRAAGTVFLVTHSLNEVQSNCTRTIWLHNGRIAMDGSPDDVVQEYKEFAGT